MNSSEYLKKNEELKSVLKDLSSDPRLTSEKMLEFFKKFNNIYSDGFRHDYSEVTRILFSLNDEKDTRDFMGSNIKDIYSYSKEIDEKEKSKNESNTTKSLRKLHDHINLENIRMAELIKISREATSANEAAATMVEEFEKSQVTIKDLNSKIKEAKNEMQGIQERMKNSTTESITILSIFAGIVMAFSGGMSFISNAISGINKIGPYRLVIFILLIGNIMFNIIFLLLYMVGKITKRYTGSSFGCIKPREHCECRGFSCYIVKYPYIAWFNLINVAGIIIAFYMSIVDRFNIFSRIINKEYAWLTFAIITILILVVIFICTINKFKRYKCKTK